MANHRRMEYINLIPWKRSPKDEELGFDEDNFSDSGSHVHHPIGSRPSCGSTFSLNEGDLQFLGFAREDTGSMALDESAMNHGRGCLTAAGQGMMIAIEEKDARAVDFFLRSGADPNARFGINKTTPLHLATAQGTLEIINLLTQAGADVQAADSRGVTMLHVAAGMGSADIVQLLIDNGADVNAQDLVRESGGGAETPLHRASTAGSLETLKRLLAAGANVNAGDAKGKTPLHCAAQRGAAGCLQALLDHGADPNLHDKRGAAALLLLGGSYLMRGHRRASGYSDSVEILVKGGANVNVQDPDTDVTPLHQAVTLGRMEPIKSLLSAGAKLNAQDREGVTPLHVCCLRGHSAILKLLLSHPAAKDGINLSDSKGRTALHKAAYRGSVECIHLLLNYGADLGLKTKSGVSAVTLILQLPTGTKILGERLDQSISTNSIDPNEFSCRLKFDFSILLSRQKFQQMGVVEDILDENRQRRTADLLQHPLIEAFLFLKWRKIRLLFFSTVIFYLILVAGVTAYVLSATSFNAVDPDPANNATHNATKQEPETVFNLQQSLSVIILIIIFQEVVQFASLHIQYFREAESWIKVGALITSTIVIFSPPPWADWVNHVAALAVLFGWTELTLLLGRLPSFGVYALMFYSVAQHLVKFIFVFFFFLAGFSFSFHIMFMDKKEAFASPWTSILRTLSMMIGDVNYDEYLTGDNYKLSGTAQIIYFCFLILVALILMNLLIGLAVNDIQGLQKEGLVKRLRKQAQFIVYLEDVASNRFLKMILREKITNKFNEWVNEAPTFTINPGSVRQPKIRLPSSTVEHALIIAQEGRVPADRVTSRDTYNLVHDCIASVDALRLRVEQLERRLVGPPDGGLPASTSVEVLSRQFDMPQGDDERQLPVQQDTDRLSSDTDENMMTPDQLYDQDEVDGGGSREQIARSRGVDRTLRSDLDEIKRMLNKLAPHSAEGSAN